MEEKISSFDQITVCPRFERTFDILGKKWHALIIDILYQANRPCRFSEISRAIIMISDHLLTSRLKELEKEGIVNKITDEDNPKKTAYRLTKKGDTLAESMQVLKKWSKYWME